MKTYLPRREVATVMPTNLADGFAQRSHERQQRLILKKQGVRVRNQRQIDRRQVDVLLQTLESSVYLYLVAYSRQQEELQYW